MQKILVEVVVNDDKVSDAVSHIEHEASKHGTVITCFEVPLTDGDKEYLAELETQG